jgi:hypothetical protein
MEILLSLLVAVIGALIYALSANPKLNQMGLIAYGAGLLAFLLQMGGMHVGWPHS